MGILDLSAAFDTVCHDILLRRLESDMGVCGTALAWLSCHLANRRQCVSIARVTSGTCSVQFGVPKGSVLGPQLFFGYTRPPGSLIRSHGLDHDFYADDSQLFVFVRPVQAQVDGAVDRVQLCVRDIRIWMRNHFLKLNDRKTEMLVVGSRKQLSIVHIPDVAVGNAIIAPSTKVRDLAVVLHTEMTMVDQINSVCGSICHQIRNISLIRRFLCQETCRQVVHASVTLRLDLCNSLLVGLPRSTTGKLQQCQDMAARVITLTLKSEHITPVLRELHWLPVEQRVNFKVLIQVYKALHGLAPDYMVDLLHRYQPGRALLSSTDGHLLDEPWTTTS